MFLKNAERDNCAYIGEEEVGIRSRLLSRQGLLSIQTLPRASGSHLAGTHRYRADANIRTQEVEYVTKLGTTCVLRPENIARIANAVQVATLYSGDKIDKKDLSTGR